jgi:D-alanine-D-alanine ligase
MKKDLDDPGRLPLNIAILYSDAKREYFPTEQQYITEAEVKGRAIEVGECLKKIGVKVTLLPGNQDVTENLKKLKPDFALNLVDSVYGQEYLSATIPATLELLKIPYVGTGMMGLTINSNKFFTKNLMSEYGITTPKYQLITSPNTPIDQELDFPLIAKLNSIHGSVEINDSAVCEDEKALNNRIDFLMNTYHQDPVLVEEFIYGREITVIVLEGLNTKVYAAEKIFSPTAAGKYKIASFDVVWGDNPTAHEAITYQKYELPKRVVDQIRTVYEILKMEDYAKFDFRVDESGRHYLIDANANSALGPNECAISSVLALYGIDFTEILRRLIVNTLDGNHLL